MALRAKVRRFCGMLGCGNGMRRMEVRVVIGMFVVFVSICTGFCWRFVESRVIVLLEFTKYQRASLEII